MRKYGDRVTDKNTDKNMKILHGITEIAGQNSYAVQGLREIGLDAESVVLMENVFGYKNDICLHIDRNDKKKLPVSVLKLGRFLVRALRKYTVFHFHAGNSIGFNHELFLYKLFHKKLFYEFHGSDIRDIRKFCETSKMEYLPDMDIDEHTKERNRKICRKADGIILHDDELIPYLPETHAPVYGVPLRVDIERFTPTFPETDPKTIRIVHAPSRRGIKGTQFILDAFDRLKEKYPNLEFVLVEGKTQEEAFEIYKTADIIVDQVFVGTYGVFSIECMAMGKPVICYIDDRMWKSYPASLPVVSADCDSVEQKLEELILDGARRRSLGEAGRAYVEAYHDYRAVAWLLKGIYEGRYAPVTGREAFRRVKRIKEIKYGADSEEK